MSNSAQADLARRLQKARITAQPLPSSDVISSVRDLKFALDTAEKLAELDSAHGRIRTGWKIGLTSKPALSAFGADEPMVGRLYAEVSIPPNSQFNLSQSIEPRIEGELIIELGSLCAADASDEELLDSISAIFPAFEIADSRIQGWPDQVEAATADNACCGWYSMPETGLPPSQVNLAQTEMRLCCNGTVVSQGNSSDCLGGVLEIYRWFVAASNRCGKELKPGDIILTGALGLPVPVQPDSRYELLIDGFDPLVLETCR